MSLAKKMSVRHEDDIADHFGTIRTPGSGNQWAKPMDGRGNRMTDGEYTFAWDCKATMSQSIGVSRAMWEKAREQSHGDRTMLPLRFYDTERLDIGLDLAVLRLDDVYGLIEDANAYHRVRFL